MYSKTANIAVGIVVLLVGAAAFSLMELIFSDYLSSGYGVTFLKKAVLHGCSLVCSTPFLVWSVYVFVQVHRIERILRRGKCYEGEIESFCMYGVYAGTELSRSGHRNIVLRISYTKNKTHYCHVGGYARNPNKVLNGRQCEVWVYEGMVFVTSFCIGKNNNKTLIPRVN